MYPSNDANCATKWLDDAYNDFLAYFVIFLFIFVCTTFVSAVQLGRWVYYTGCNVNVPKLLHFVIFVQGCIRISWFLTGGIDILRNLNSQTWEIGLLDGLGLACLLVCYMLSILLWLQIYHQITGAGARRSCCLRHRNMIVIGAIAGYIAAEITIRVVWNVTESLELKIVAIAVYHMLLVLATVLCTITFTALSVLLYRILRETDKSMVATRERLANVVTFTVFTLIVSIATLLLIIVFFFVEFMRFQWTNWNSWLVEQMFLRCLEASYAIGALWFLRKMPAHEIKAERRPLMHTPSPVQSSETTGDRSDDEEIRRVSYRSTLKKSTDFGTPVEI